MKIVERISVPTGDILIVQGEEGLIEMLSLGDYGKDINIKADFLNLTRIPEKVRHTELLPLEKKWVITISTQYGCSMGCPYCDVPKVGPGMNVSFSDLVNQVRIGLDLHPEVKYSERLNIHFARMGEPTFNNKVILAAQCFKESFSEYNVHPVVSTMCPTGNRNFRDFISKWMMIKNITYKGNAGLQLSINSTDEESRKFLFNNNALTLREISNVMSTCAKPVGRKIALNFAVAEYPIDGKELLKYFSPDNYMVKLTPMHKTLTALKNNIKTSGDYTEYYPYEEAEKSCNDAGYETLVFIASYEEDMGRITCGNAILSGSKPFEE